LIALWVILDAAVERIGGPDLPGLRRDHQVIRLRGQIYGAHYGEAVEDERQAPSGKKVRLVGKTEMQVGALGGTGVPDPGDERPGLHDIADLHREAARVQMRVEREDVRGDFQNNVIAAIVFLRFRYHRHIRG